VQTAPSEPIATIAGIKVRQKVVQQVVQQATMMGITFSNVEDRDQHGT
jgi:hypothetical protein